MTISICHYTELRLLDKYAPLVASEQVFQNLAEKWLSTGFFEAKAVTPKNEPLSVSKWQSRKQKQQWTGLNFVSRSTRIRNSILRSI